MKYLLNEKARKVVEETATTARLITRLFPDDTISLYDGITFLGDDLIALHSALETLADKLSDLQYESENSLRPQRLSRHSPESQRPKVREKAQQQKKGDLPAHGKSRF